MAKLFADKLKILESDIQNISESFTKERIDSIEESIKTVNNQTADQLENINKFLSAINTEADAKLSNLSKATEERINELEKSIKDNNEQMNKQITDTVTPLKNNLTQLVSSTNASTVEKNNAKIENAKKEAFKRINEVDKTLGDRVTTLTNIVNTGKADTTNKISIITGQINALQEQTQTLADTNTNLQKQVEDLTKATTSLQEQVTKLNEATARMQTKITQMIDELNPIITSHAEALKILIGNKELNGKK